MQVRNVYAYGVLDAIYYVNKGEKIPWHDHKHQPDGHGHFVIQGRTLVEIEGQPPQERTSNDPHIEFDKDIPHQVTAIEDNTIFSHRMKMRERKPGEMVDYPPPLPQKNRVLMADGTIVEIG